MVQQGNNILRIWSSTAYLDWTLIAFALLLGLIVRALYYIILGQDIVMVSDSWTYLNAAKALEKSFYLDVYRPPVYIVPVLVSGIIFSWEKFYIGVIIFQSLLSMLSTILIYKISLLIMAGRLTGFFTALVVNLSIAAYGWDFMVMTESLSIFFVTLITYLILAYFKEEKKILLYYLLGAVILAIFTKPFFIFLPPVILAIFVLNYLLGHSRKLRVNLKTIAVGCIIIYTLVFGYSVLNFKVNGFLGMTSVSNVNIFGKILQYKMEYLGNNQDLKSDISCAYTTTTKDNLVGGTFLEPWGFLSQYGWGKDNYGSLGKFSKSIILEHPFTYIKESIILSAGLLKNQCPFNDYIALKAIEKRSNIPFFNVIDSINRSVDKVNSLYLLILLSLIELLIYLAYKGWSTIQLRLNSTPEKENHSSRLNKIGIITVVVIILYHYLTSAFFSYGDYCRLLAPSYYLIYFLIVYNIFRILGLLRSLFQVKAI